MMYGRETEFVNMSDFSVVDFVIIYCRLLTLAFHSLCIRDWRKFPKSRRGRH